MSQYEEMDRRIMAAIGARKNPLYARHCCEEAERIAKATGRQGYRVIDLRLQALRKAGKIRHFTKAEKDGGGWHLVTPND